MALIEIDCQPAVGRIPAKWSVKINAKERSGLPDLEVNDLPSYKDALVEVERYMVEEVLL